MHKTEKQRKQIEFGLIQLAPFQLAMIRKIAKLNFQMQQQQGEEDTVCKK